MKKVLSVLGVLLMFSGITVSAIHSELAVNIPKAETYEQNVVEHIRGNYWDMSGGYELGDTSEMTEEEIAALEEEFANNSGAEALGKSDEFEFKYYYDVNGRYLYQVAEIDGQFVIVRWDGDTALDITAR